MPFVLQCVAELNELEYERPEDGEEKEGETKTKLYVGRAQKKGERQAELRRKYEEMKAQRDQRYQVRSCNHLANS